MTKEETPEDREKRRVGNEVMDKVIRAMDSFYPTSEKAMVWLLKFLQTDFTKLGPTDFDPLRYQIASFVWHGPPQLQRISLASAKEWQTHVYDRLSIPSLNEAEALQKYLRGLLDEFMREGKLSYQMPVMTKHIVRRPRLAKIGGRTVRDQTLPDIWWEASTVQDAFTYYFDQLLDRFALCLGRCPSTDKHEEVCGKIYLSTRRDQKYCRTRCENRVTARQYRIRKKRASRNTEAKGGRNGTKRR